MEYKVIIVDSEPYCIWEHSIQEQNKLFLEGIDTGYFEYILDSHTENNPDKNIPYEEQVRASVVLRSAYHHAMETMFSLLCSFVQSPQCTYAWMIKCKNIELVNVIKRINSEDSSLHHELKTNGISWEEISEMIFYEINFESCKNKEIVSLYATLWGRLADEYCDKNKTLEYNSIKHGLRIRSGGHSFSFGVTGEEMMMMANSKFGSSFIKLEPCNQDKGNRSLVSKKVTLGWEIENIIDQLYLVISSIKNIVLRLKYINECKIEDEEQFNIPADEKLFDRAWERHQMMSNLEMWNETDDAQPIPITRKKLLEAIEELKRSNNKSL